MCECGKGCLTPTEVAALVQDEIASRYHPEFGTEWREDGDLFKHVAAREAAAYRRGAEAMREAAADEVEHDYVTEPDASERQFVIRQGDPGIADAIRHLPIPEDKP
jgi:hypothetical protein